MDNQITEIDVLRALGNIQDPDLGRDIVSLGFVKNLKINGPVVSFDLELTTPACPIRAQFKQECEARVGAIPGVKEVCVHLTYRVSSRPEVEEKNILSTVKNVIAIASGKGGVGKSTVAANLAAALSKAGAKVGLLDCDVYGPSIPLMFGLRSRKPEMASDGRIYPLESCGISVMSIGFLMDEGEPVIWRGPMAHKMIQQFLTHVIWGDLDYLFLDLPPGTGDVQLTLTQSAPLSGAVIVTTPQEISLIDARKGLTMFTKCNVPIIGLVENMSYFTCPHCQKISTIFKRGGGQKMAEELGVPFLGDIPIDPKIVESSDEGIPEVIKTPGSATAKAYEAIVSQMAARLSVINSKKSV
jgi:ATP-binding protein involved in chromosome partitioning